MADPTIKDLAYRALASAIGGPVDITASIMRPFGYSSEQPVLGSEWIGKKMEETGLVSEARNPIQEFLASVAVPSPTGIAKGTAMAIPAIAGMTKKAGKEAMEYAISHRPMTVESGAAELHNLLPVFGEDIYGKNALQYFGSGDEREKAVLNILKKAKGNPEAKITIYRGVPNESSGINAGDWITLHPGVAKDYADLIGGKVVKMEVPAAHITAWPDSLLEQGYYPK